MVSSAIGALPSQLPSPSLQLFLRIPCSCTYPLAGIEAPINTEGPTVLRRMARNWRNDAASFVRTLLLPAP